MQAPYQVLIIPYRQVNSQTEFAILKRSDAGYWQFVAGGGEFGEVPIQAAKRETREEIGITGEIFQLDSMTTVPRSYFPSAEAWDPDVFVIPEYSFAVAIKDKKIILSDEHTEYRWVSRNEASSLLKWDSNRNALWELNERLKSSSGDDVVVDIINGATEM